MKRFLPSVLFVGMLTQGGFLPLGGPYPVQKKPGTTPEIFAPGVVSLGFHEHNIAISPDGREIFFVAAAADFSRYLIMTTRLKNGAWTTPEVAPFSGGRNDGAPAFSPDGKRLHFSSRRPRQAGAAAAEDFDIWYVERRGDSWTEPENLGGPVNSWQNEANPSVASDGTLYFQRIERLGTLDWDLCRAPLTKGAYGPPEKLPTPVNTEANEAGPFIAPDGSYLLFQSNRPGGYGVMDIYAAYRTMDGGWTDPVNLGEKVNSAFSDWGPVVSPDGKYLFFSSFRNVEPIAPGSPDYLEYMTARLGTPSPGKGTLYWVEAKVIDALRPERQSVPLLAGLASMPGRISGSPERIPPSQASGAKEPRGIPKTAVEFSERVREVDEYLQGFMKTSVVPGVSIAMGVGDEFTQFRGYGFSDLASRRPVTPQTQFRIGSVSKTLTGVALGLLLEEKKLDLDADVRSYVPEFPDKGSPITLRHLAYHRSGIRHYRGDEVLNDRYYKSVLDALKVFAGSPLIAKPGAAWSYSTYGYVLLSAAMERGADQSYPTLMRERILRPLQMTQTDLEAGGLSFPDQATGYEAGAGGKPEVAPKTDLSFVWAGGGFVSTAGDLLKFARALVNGEFLRKETLDLLWTPQPGRDKTKATLGIGWQVARTPKGQKLLVAGGNSIGGTTVMFVVPEERVVMVLMTNMGNAPIRGTPRKALGILLGEDGA